MPAAVGVEQRLDGTTLERQNPAARGGDSSRGGIRWPFAGCRGPVHLAVRGVAQVKAVGRVTAEVGGGIGARHDGLHVEGRARGLGAQRRWQHLGAHGAEHVLVEREREDLRNPPFAPTRTLTVAGRDCSGDAGGGTATEAAPAGGRPGRDAQPGARSTIAPADRQSAARTTRRRRGPQAGRTGLLTIARIGPLRRVR